ncbi:putative transcription factor interactor and regulator CCHC(Zn) family [Helianthus debilis subsp. tardiflorus]
MASLATVLESYESLVAGRIGIPMLTKEGYDQIDSEELELMDIKWCLASVLRRAEKFKQITRRDDLREAATSQLGFDKSKVTCFRCRGKGHFKRECTNREATGRQDPFGNNDYHRKAIYHQVAQQPRPIEESKGKACFGLLDQEDERIPKDFNWDDYDPSRPSVSKAFVSRFLEDSTLGEESVKSKNGPRRQPIFNSSGSDDTDDEEEYINKSRKQLDPYSFDLFFCRYNRDIERENGC